MRRREFIGLAIGVAACPSVAQAQAVPIIGHMHAGQLRQNSHIVRAFEEGLAQVGFIKGRNVAIEYRWADGHYDRLPAIADELVRRNVAVLATGTPVAALAAKKATTTIPIVFAVGSDPVQNRLVESLNHPGGNMTGATFFSNLLTGKRLALLHQMVPKAKVFGVLVNPDNANAQMQFSEAAQAARTLGVRLVLARATGDSELGAAFELFKQEAAEGLLVLSDSILNALAPEIASRAIARRIPTCFAYRAPVVAGGLISYGAQNTTDATRHAGTYAGRILKGEKPADLPVQQPTKFEFVINLITAKALELEIPNSLQLLADEVIE